MSGLTVAVDPGHSRQIGDGTAGPQGILEGEANFKMALRLKEKLEKLGARVFMTRACPALAAMGIYLDFLF
ncbi:MAG: hypothetical protein EPO39_07810 [Candidatus Manganitrophaceae bacterium]|nr:MAG: hypothetical protein EPO39_07810 [Candidatus Manganitrophaceae bacterium]